MKLIKRKGVYLLSIESNRKKYLFLLDTGSEFSYIYKNSLEDLTLKKLSKSILLRGVGGENIIREYVNIDRIKIGNIAIENQDFLVSVDISLKKLLRIDGVLGWDILKKFDFSLDFYNENMEFFTVNNKSKLTTSNTYEYTLLNETFPIFSAKYSNNDVLFLLDTGSNLSYIVNENLVFKNKKISFSISIGINGIHFSKVCKVNPIPIIDRNGKYYKTPRLLYEKYSQKYDFLLGCNSFKNKIVYFFNSNNLVLVEDKNI